VDTSELPVGSVVFVVHPGNVFLENGRMSEVLAADRTVILFHSGVNLAVPRKHRKPRETLVTHRTLKRTLTTVYHLTCTHTHADQYFISHRRMLTFSSKPSAVSTAVDQDYF